MDYGFLHMMEDSNMTESDADKELKGWRKYTNEKNQSVKLYLV